MKKIIPWIILSFLISMMITLSFKRPYLLDDTNSFFSTFVGNDLLSTLGIILSVTLASAASLHLELNKLEENSQRRFFGTRAAIRKSAYSLLLTFTFAFILVCVKPLIPKYGSYCALANSISILIIYFNLAILFDITKTVFLVPPASRGGNKDVKD